MAGVSPSGKPFTPKQGQYLAFIHLYTRLHRQPPAETDMQQYFRVSPPSVHQMNALRDRFLSLVSLNSEFDLQLIALADRRLPPPNRSRLEHRSNGGPGAMRPAGWGQSRRQTPNHPCERREPIDTSWVEPRRAFLHTCRWFVTGSVCPNKWFWDGNSRG
jgi:hypothetical protein